MTDRDLELLSHRGELWKFSSLQFTDGCIVTPSGGVFVRLLGGQPVCCFNLADDRGGEWDYVVPLTAIRRICRPVPDEPRTPPADSHSVHVRYLHRNGDAP